MMRIVKTGCLLLPAMIIAIGCTAPPPDEISTPTAPPVEPGPADPDAPADFTTTSSGLKYKILREGEGASPSESDTVRCHYRGWLDDGTEFDSSYSRGEPAEFPLYGVIPGWTEGLQLVKEGGMIELEIPYQLGYGEEGQPPIPPRATLHFTVELIEVL
jgi:FKBP-type peptidyl-prolyl cis-trans isomerase